MPQVAQAVKKLCGKDAIRGTNNFEDTAVAVGAAIRAYQIFANKNQKEISLLPPSKQRSKLLARIPKDVTSHSLGMIAENADRSAYVNAIILSKNQPIPNSETRTLKYRTSSHNKDMECDVYLLQGECNEPWKNTILGHYIFSGIQHESNGQALIDITYNYDANGTVGISAKQQSTGTQLAMRVEAVSTDMQWMYGSPKDRAGTSEYEHFTVLIAVDTSGSMSGNAFTLAKQAANEFVNKMDLSHCSIGLIRTPDGSSNASLVLHPSQNRNEINSSIQSLYDNWTGEALFGIAKKELANREGKKYMIVLTDGQWGGTAKMESEARECHSLGIDIAAVGFGSINEPFLRAISNWDMIVSSPEKFGESFSTIAQVLNIGGKLK
jgi:molecular chaperone DnaK